MVLQKVFKIIILNTLIRKEKQLYFWLEKNEL